MNQTKSWDVFAQFMNLNDKDIFVARLVLAVRLMFDIKLGIPKLGQHSTQTKNADAQKSFSETVVLLDDNLSEALSLYLHRMLEAATKVVSQRDLLRFHHLVQTFNQHHRCETTWAPFLLQVRKFLEPNDSARVKPMPGAWPHEEE
jgi:hypothetical protein